jgi:hypothetical protein
MKIITGLIMGMLSTIAVALFSVSATADDHYKFYQSAAPIICGDTKTVMEFGAEKGWIPFSVSFGKVNGKEDGDIAFVVTHWLKRGTTEQMVTMQAPDGSEACILYISFDTTINPNFNLKGLDL